MLPYLRFKNWPILLKLLSAYLLLLGGIVGGIQYYYLPLVEQQLHEEANKSSRFLVEVAFSYLESFRERVERGDLTVEEARREALLELRNMRYNTDNHFWITDTMPRMILHPLHRELEGTSLTNYADAAGKKLYVEAARLAETKGEGWVDYISLREGKSKELTQRAFVKYFRAWDWVVGTGIHTEDIQANITTLRNDVYEKTGFITIFFFVLLFVLSLYITRPLRKATTAAKKISEGDLTVKIIAKSKDEMGSLLSSTSSVVSKLNDILDNIIPTAMQVEEITGSLKEVAARTTESAHNQTNKSEEIAASSEEMSQTIAEIARNISVASERSTSSMGEAEKGKQMANESVRAMTNMNQSIQDLSDMVHRLNGRMSEVGQVVVMIKEIADQTNLLALNAAIEAARAGGHGTRFAVVSDEVRKLAERTIQSTEKISESVRAIQTETEQTAVSMLNTTREVETTTEQIQEMGETLNQIANAFRDVKDEITHVASAVEEQSVTSKQVARGVEHNLLNSKEIEAQAREVENSVMKLTEVADKLRDSTMGIKTRSNRTLILDLARTDHRIFMNNIEEHLKDTKHLEENDITDHYHCRFGKWYYSEGKHVAGHLQLFKEIESPHEKIHKFAREVVHLKNRGEEAKARDLFDHTLNDISSQIQSMLLDLKADYKELVNQEK